LARRRPQRQWAEFRSCWTAKWPASGARRKCELEGGSLPGHRDKLQLAAVSLHDRAADGQSHSHSFRFRRKEAIENMDRMLRIEASARVLYGYQYFPRFLRLRTDVQFPLFFHESHCLDAIHHKVQDNLLQFNPGTQHWGQAGGQFSLNGNMSLLGFCGGERKNLVNNLV